MLPEPRRRTSLIAQMSIHAFLSSLQIIAVARSGLIEVPLSLVVRTFQAPKGERLSSGRFDVMNCYELH